MKVELHPNFAFISPFKESTYGVSRCIIFSGHDSHCSFKLGAMYVNLLCACTTADSAENSSWVFYHACSPSPLAQDPES